MGKLFIVLALSVGGLGNRIYQSGDIVSEEAFDAKNLPDIIEGGYIAEHSEKTRKDFSELETAKAVLAEKLAAASEFANKAAEFKMEADVAEKESEEAEKVAANETEEDKESAKKIAEEKLTSFMALSEKSNDAAIEADKASIEATEAQLAVDKLSAPTGKAKKK